MINFNEYGRRIPSDKMRLFSDKPSFYYGLDQPLINFSDVLSRSKRFGILDSEVDLDFITKQASDILEDLKNDESYANLLNGVHIPFITDAYRDGEDLGVNLEEKLLVAAKNSFNEKFPESHFKAILQSNSKLQDNISLDNNSNYYTLLNKIKSGPVVGWYFPQALQEFDVKSQRAQMLELEKCIGSNVCLSGGLDIIASLVAFPELLISSEKYSPILNLSAYVHADPRLVLLLKAYGPHMEFWCMSQMLTSGVTQVSEQWSGGITIFR